jgi:hypothetical protein
MVVGATPQTRCPLSRNDQLRLNDVDGRDSDLPKCPLSGRNGMAIGPVLDKLNL